jgi:hypothetical protein
MEYFKYFIPGVTVGMKGNTSCDLFAKYIISDAGVSNTFKHLLPKEIAVKSCKYIFQ